MTLFKLHQLELSGVPNLFTQLDWEMKQGETWVVYGPSGTGKSLLKNILLNRVPIYAHSDQHSSISSNTTCVEISPELELKLLEREQREDDSEFIEGGYDPGRSALEIVTEHQHENFKDLNNWIDQFQLQSVLKTSYKKLSNGETRKVLWLRALVQNPDLIIFDSPFEGLDPNTRSLLHEVFNSNKIETSKIIFLQRLEDIPDKVDGLLALHKTAPPKVYRDQKWKNKLVQSSKIKFEIPEAFKALPTLKKSQPFIQFKNLNIQYDEKVVFKNFSWEMKPGENWLFSGPNGAGKTTLLQLIHADHPQSYGQEIQLFGFKRGSGESIWDIKAHIGFVSADFQRHFPQSLTGTAMVVSGLFDSMGVYRQPSPQQLQLSHDWLNCLNIEHLSQKYVSQMSWGEIRMLMIARALIKKPNLLILDEPCQGLDDGQKSMVLELIENCCHSFDINIIYVSHHHDERLPCLTHHLQWVEGKGEQYDHQLHQL